MGRKEREGCELERKGKGNEMIERKGNKRGRRM